MRPLAQARKNHDAELVISLQLGPFGGGREECRRQSPGFPTTPHQQLSARTRRPSFDAAHFCLLASFEPRITTSSFRTVTHEFDPQPALGIRVQTARRGRPAQALRAPPPASYRAAAVSEGSNTHSRTLIHQIGRELTHFFARAQDERAPASEEKQIENRSRGRSRHRTVRR
ncbi:hypothetical protein BDV96DRAFT_328141 [Lophiotrema nucula]|uniref:Uncharacterized protein n=1 Tax=Lophiotrema nucula TaxID=690887 RepID=A0A6A5YI56_9PLEO|nr:hypothetical protein BDV96DRAFT_328141 [Lophiotrema nucula]